MASVPGEQAPQATGRSVVVFDDDVRGDRESIAATLRSLAAVTTVVSSADCEDGAPGSGDAAGGEAIAFDALGVAVVAVEPAALRASVASAQTQIVAVEPERVMRAISVRRPVAAARFVDDAEFTWGLRATGVDATGAAGGAIRVAVLDTGLDLDHPGFAGRSITAQSFIAGAAVEDRHGHGTHCAGTACGPATPVADRRYGIASEARIFAGKVLDDTGAGTDASILAGIEWAIMNGCGVISISLGADIPVVSTAYETVGRRALAAGTLIVAAAGNNASRSDGFLGFVGVPANSPSIMAVAAVDADLRVADFSAASNPIEGGQIDIAGPGVAVYSSWPMPRRTNTISGTSMAAPHVAGIAALWSQTTGATARALWHAVVEAAQGLDLPASDVGAGLVRAPD